jgi:hypothetical protein
MPPPPTSQNSFSSSTPPRVWTEYLTKLLCIDTDVYQSMRSFIQLVMLSCLDKQSGNMYVCNTLVNSYGIAKNPQEKYQNWMDKAKDILELTSFPGDETPLYQWLSDAELTIAACALGAKLQVYTTNGDGEPEKCSELRQLLDRNSGFYQNARYTFNILHSNGTHWQPLLPCNDRLISLVTVTDGNCGPHSLLHFYIHNFFRLQPAPQHLQQQCQQIHAARHNTLQGSSHRQQDSKKRKASCLAQASVFNTHEELHQTKVMHSSPPKKHVTLSNTKRKLKLVEVILGTAENYVLNIILKNIKDTFRQLISIRDHLPQMDKLLRVLCTCYFFCIYIIENLVLDADDKLLSLEEFTVQLRAEIKTFSTTLLAPKGAVQDIRHYKDLFTPLASVILDYSNKADTNKVRDALRDTSSNLYIDSTYITLCWDHRNETREYLNGTQETHTLLTLKR